MDETTRVRPALEREAAAEPVAASPAPSPAPSPSTRTAALPPWRRKARAGHRLAPSPPLTIPRIAHLPGRGAERLYRLVAYRERYGDIVRFELPWGTIHVLAHPDHVRTVLQDPERAFTKETRGTQMLRRFLGQGLVTSGGALWRRQRRIAQPAFTKAKIESFGPAMVRAAEDLSARWDAAAKRGAVVDVASDMMALTLRVAGSALLSADPSNEAQKVGPAVEVLLNDAVSRVVHPLSRLPSYLPSPRNLRARRAMAELDGIVYRLIADRRQQRQPPRDLLQLLLEAEDPDTGDKMSDQQLRDEVMTMFVAGHETTSNALTWTFMLLSRFPAVARKVRDEVRSTLGEKRVTVADIPRLSWTGRVALEAMRLYPPVHITGRHSVHQMELGGFDIPAQSTVFVSPWVTHRHPDFWTNPEGFDPDRFLPTEVDRMHRFQYFPFGGGPRMCIGAGFARQELVLVLATLVRRHRLDLVSARPVEPLPLVTLRPQGGLRMRAARW